jgi:hypothetical protein
MEIKFIQRFDPRRNLQYVNDEPSVMHCHHYAALFTKLALDNEEIGGPSLLADSMEESFFLVLKKYYLMHGITGIDEMIGIAEDYFSKTGMGKISITFSGDGGSARMSRAHVDEGWIKKWGKHDKAVNHMGRGYISAVFCLAAGLPLRSFTVIEDSSIVKGAQQSSFTVKQRARGEYDRQD